MEYTKNESVVSNFENTVSGFYYDQQMANPVLRVTLHPNMKYTGTAPDYWEKVSGTDAEAGPDKWPYQLKPIAIALVNEDFTVSISNSWSDFGGDPIADMWNSQKPMAPYMRDIAKSLGTISAKTEGYANNENIKDQTVMKIISKVGEIAGNVSNQMETQAKYLNRSLVVQGTRFSYYGGTGIDFGNLSMKFTLFPTYVNGKFTTVNEQLVDLLPYIIGDYIPVTELKDLGQDVNNFVKEFAAWQLPPGGFEADIKDVDNVQKGTLKLRFGIYYALDNLVISGCNLNFSKTLLKDPTQDKRSFTTGHNLSPMYCDVMLQFRPATKYSKNKLLQFINAKSANTEILLERENANIAKNLLSIKEKNNSSLTSFIHTSGDDIASFKQIALEEQLQSDIEEAAKKVGGGVNLPDSYGPNEVDGSGTNIG